MHNPTLSLAPRAYWIRVYLLYLVFEACIQLFFFFTLNSIDWLRISDIEVHLLMWIFQGIFILPIWGVAYLFRSAPTWQQVIANAVFFIAYTFFWFGPVMDCLAWMHRGLQDVTQPGNQDRIIVIVDSWTSFYYQVLKHGLRLGWFLVAYYFYRFKTEEKERLELLIANKELQLNLVKWHLNPSFYFRTIDTIASKAKVSPAECSGPILNLSKVMEHVIYRSPEKLISVEEELIFLRNYIRLHNLQDNRATDGSLDVAGDYSGLLIIPLLLVSFLEDSLSNNSDDGARAPLYISFDGNSMRIKLPRGISHVNQDTLTRLRAYYGDRHRFIHNETHTCLEIQLDISNDR